MNTAGTDRGSMGRVAVSSRKNQIIQIIEALLFIHHLIDHTAYPLPIIAPQASMPLNYVAILFRCEWLDGSGSNIGIEESKKDVLKQPLLLSVEYEGYMSWWELKAPLW